MGWVCKYCSTNNEDSATRCIVCDNARSYAVTRTLTPIRVSELGLSGDVIIPEDYNVVGVGAFQNRTDITSVTIHSGVKKILKDAFSGCTNLRDVHNHAELNCIGARAFYGCRSLAPTKRPTARYVHEEAFAGCEVHTSSGGGRPAVSASSATMRPLTYTPSEGRPASMSDATRHSPTVTSHTEETHGTIHKPSSEGTGGKSSGIKWFARVLIVGIAVAAAVTIAFIFKQVF